MIHSSVLKATKIGRGEIDSHIVNLDKDYEGSLYWVSICGVKGKKISKLYDHNSDTPTDCLRCNTKLGFLVKDKTSGKFENIHGQHTVIGYTQTNYKVIKDHRFRGQDYKTGQLIYGKAYDNDIKDGQGGS